MQARLIGSVLLVALTAGACTAGGATGSSVTPGSTPPSRASSAAGSVAPTPVSPAPSATPTSTGRSTVDLNAELRAAASANDVAAAKRLIAAGADVNAKSELQESAYLLAASEGATDVLELILDHGALVDDKDSYNGTALIRAAERGHYQIVGLLLRAGNAKDHVNRLSWQAIHEAIWLGTGDERYEATIRVLVAAGVQVDRPDGSGRTPVQMAQQRGPAAVVDLLVQAAKPYQGDPTSNLLAAAKAGDANGVALALRAGASLEATDRDQRTPLLLAAAADRVAAARVLVALGANPNALDAQHDTPWLVTGVTGSVAMLETLLPAHPDLTIRNRFGGISIIPAAERGHVEYVRRVVSTGINVNHVNDLGWTALLEAVILGDGGPRHQEIVRILLAAGADRTIPDKNGVTALRHAEQKGYTEMAAILRS